MDKIKKTESEWKEILSPQEFEVTRKKGTEKPYTGEYYEHSECGTYLCKCCNEELFDSKSKYHSGSGWPSFTDVLSKESIITQHDSSYGMNRIEIKCARCDAHLGHLFPDGPSPTFNRYCINSVSLNFQKKE